MRTNTWLALIALNQTVGIWNQSVEMRKLSAQQEERDRRRDAEVARFEESARRGNFAIWIQTADGQWFEEWAEHALRASRALDERQDAWELAWENERQLEEKWIEEATEEYVAENMEPVQKIDQQRTIKWAGASCVVSIVGIVLMYAVAALSRGPIVAGPYSWLMWPAVTAFLGGGLIGAFMFLASVGAPKHEEEQEQFRREILVREFSPEKLRTAILETPPSWHSSANSTQIRSMSADIVQTVSEASKLYPRKDDLVDLSAFYSSQDELVYDELPDSIRLLLEAFQADDALELDKLRIAGLV